MNVTPGPAEATKTDGKRQRIGEKLISLGLITRDQLDVALHEKSRSPKMLGTVMVELGFITEDTLSSVLSETTGSEKFEFGRDMVDPDAISKLPKQVAVKHSVLPISVTADTVVVAMADPYDVIALDQVRRYFPRGINILTRIATSAEMAEAIDAAYGYIMSIDGIVEELQTGKVDITSITAGEGDYSHPIVRLVNALVLDAVKMGASDIHFEPEEMFVRLRYRIDGVMTQVRTFHKDHWSAMSHRIKIFSGMNIADKINPQDGRFDVNIGGRHADFRVSSLPTVHGENIVIRVLDKAKALLTLEDLGFGSRNLARLQRALMRPEGIVVVTGPTGSGKTTTLYAMLKYINSIEVNIMTLEDPVEYEMSLIRQSQVREGTGVSFTEGVRAVLRQDPDIIFIGEVRDQDTAQMALRAAMTGHQVFTSLHTNDAISVIPRLLDLGLSSSMMAGNVIAALGQRLVRRLCSDCKRPRNAKPEECRILGGDPHKPPVVYDSVGCDKCRNTGYRGRVAVTEILVMNDDIDEIVARGGTRSEIKAVAVAGGYRTMADDGIDKVLDGAISLPGLIRSVDMTGRL